MVVADPSPRQPQLLQLRGWNVVMVLVLLLQSATTSSALLLSPAAATLTASAKGLSPSSPTPLALKESSGFKQLELDLLKKQVLTDSDLRQLFDGYKKAFNKKYASEKEDMEYRFELFVATVDRVRSHNAAAAIGEHSYTMGLSKFADLTQEEQIVANGAMGDVHDFNLGENDDNGDYYEVSTTSHNLLTDINATTYHYLGVPFEQHVRQVPKMVDWVEKGAVTPSVDQGSCSSCWAFAAVAAVESARFQKTGVLEKLAVQPLVDCLPTGCIGDQPARAFNKMMEWGGFLTEASYPYTGNVGECRFDEYGEEDLVELPFNEWRAVKDDEASLKLAISQHAGIVVSVWISHKELAGYTGGIYDGCEKLHSNNNDGIFHHAMQLVGYGSEGQGANKKKYWLLKNSWGAEAGEDGYVRILRGSKRSWKRGFRKGNCDITSKAIVISERTRELGGSVPREAAAWEDRERTSRMMCKWSGYPPQCRQKGKKGGKKQRRHNNNQ